MMNFVLIVRKIKKMTIFEIKHGSIFDSECEALVNPVNCVGVMGAGLALEFKKRFPGMFKSYIKDCDSGNLKIGHITVYIGLDYPAVVNFPTKNHWKQKSKIEYIEQGLNALVDLMKNGFPESIAIPALGCGLGGLDWVDVERLIRLKLDGIDGLRVELYPPKERKNKCQL